MYKYSINHPSACHKMSFLFTQKTYKKKSLERKNQNTRRHKFPQKIYKYSSPRIAQRMAYKYLGKPPNYILQTILIKNTKSLIKRIIDGFNLVKWDMKIIPNIKTKHEDTTI